jgi:uncharacterized membrane protein YeaQ/YmgE (transglycosylase-associated protein family)
MAEHIAQIGPMLVLAGLTVGWLAEALRHARGPGLLGDLLVGLAGSVVGGSVVWSSVSTRLGMVAMFSIGCCAAALAIIAQRTMLPSTRSAV